MCRMSIIWKKEGMILRCGKTACTCIRKCFSSRWISPSLTSIVLWKYHLEPVFKRRGCRGLLGPSVLVPFGWQDAHSDICEQAADPCRSLIFYPQKKKT